MTEATNTKTVGVSKGCLFLLLFCVLPSTLWLINALAFPLSRNPKNAKSQIEALGPVGKPLAVATNQLAKIGCTCVGTKNTSFVDEANPGEAIRHNNIKYVECVVQRRGFIGFPEYLWVIALPYDQQGHVTNIFVSISNRSLVVP